MYVFSRMRHVNSASVREAVAAAVEVAGKVSSIAELDVSTWMTLASPAVGRITWSAMFDSVQQLVTVNQKLADSSDYGDWVDANDKLFDGPSEDALIQLVHGAPDPARTVNFVTATTAVCANGKLSAAMAAGVEVAEAATKISNIPTLFGAGQTGLYGSVVWLAAAETMGELEQGTAALAADPSWAQRLDEVGPLYQPGVETTWHQRLG